MGSCSWSSNDYDTYCKSTKKVFNAATGRATGQFYTERKLNERMNPKNVIRECVNSEEHPNTIPIILGLDVTGSMGDACKETAEALAKIVKTLHDRFADVEIMIMGIGDFEYDRAPLQVGQYESDVRIASDLDKVYMEMGGGGNLSESYSAAWYFGLHHTKLDCFDKQNNKGIIITMGDEPLNEYLRKDDIKQILGDSVQGDVFSDKLYEDASKKFDIYHIAVDDVHNCYSRYKKMIGETFGKVLGQNLIVSSIENLSNTICDCISKTLADRSNSYNVLNENSGEAVVNNNTDGISW